MHDGEGIRIAASEASSMISCEQVMCEVAINISLFAPRWNWTEVRNLINLVKISQNGFWIMAIR